MGQSDRFVAEIMDRLAGIDGLTSRRMFGALALRAHGRIFGMVAEETLYLRLDATEFAALSRLGGQPLHPVRRKPELQSSRYMSVPLEILEDDEALLNWTGRAIEAA